MERVLRGVRPAGPRGLGEHLRRLEPATAGVVERHPPRVRAVGVAEGCGAGRSRREVERVEGVVGPAGVGEDACPRDELLGRERVSGVDARDEGEGVRRRGGRSGAARREPPGVRALGVPRGAADADAKGAGLGLLRA